jgi:hypothetical protein
MPDEPIKGYVRAEGLSILATEAVLNKAKPLSGYLDIGTEDGRLRLRMNGCAAADLLVDLKNFLALEYMASAPPRHFPTEKSGTLWSGYSRASCGGALYIYIYIYPFYQQSLVEMKFISVAAQGHVLGSADCRFGIFRCVPCGPSF